MGMTIDKAITKIWHCIVSIRDCTGNKEFVEALELSVETMRKYQMMQADYENRLKADMVAMLKDLDLQIDELSAYNLEVAKVQRLIRDKIDNLIEH